MIYTKLPEIFEGGGVTQVAFIELFGGKIATSSVLVHGTELLDEWKEIQLVRLRWFGPLVTIR